MSEPKPCLCGADPCIVDDGATLLNGRYCEKRQEVDQLRARAEAAETALATAQAERDAARTDAELWRQSAVRFSDKRDAALAQADAAIASAHAMSMDADERAAEYEALEKERDEAVAKWDSVYQSPIAPVAMRIRGERDSLRARVAELEAALETIAAYDAPHRKGICPYGCDTPHIARAALAARCATFANLTELYTALKASDRIAELEQALTEISNTSLLSTIKPAWEQCIDIARAALHPSPPQA